MKSAPHERKVRRKSRIRATVQGTKGRPRLAVFRSARHMQAQLIDDERGFTIVGMRDNIEGKKKTTKMERAALLGKELSHKAKEKGITKVVFDRGGYRYHGRVRALAEAVRKEGLEF